MKVRLATASDLGAMTWILIGASPLDPIYPYRFPDRHLYADEFAELCRQKCAEYLATSTVVVCEMADPMGRSQVVAFSSWDTPRAFRAKPTGALEPLPRPSHNPVVPITIGHRDRMNVFREACVAAKRDMFDARYVHGHMFLKILLCHPEYQRRGAGRALTTWGIEEARRMRLNTTVFASPMGFELYKKLGFREVDRFRVQLEGEEVFLDIPAMVLRPDEGYGRFLYPHQHLYGVGYESCTTIACS
ncbi:hypothetical protein OQA88_1841 [Cercophora sp. LCS_1]